MHSACRHRRSEDHDLTKKHLLAGPCSGARHIRRTGMLDAMIPAATALARPPLSPKLRRLLYMPHGAVMWNTKHGKDMDHWTPSGAVRISSSATFSAARRRQAQRDLSSAISRTRPASPLCTNTNPGPGSAVSKPDLKRPVPACPDDRTKSCRAHRSGTALPSRGPLGE